MHSSYPAFTHSLKIHSNSPNLFHPKSSYSCFNRVYLNQNIPTLASAPSNCQRAFHSASTLFIPSFCISSSFSLNSHTQNFNYNTLMRNDSPFIHGKALSPIVSSAAYSSDVPLEDQQTQHEQPPQATSNFHDIKELVLNLPWKRLFLWFMFFLSIRVLSDFFPVMLGTFVLGYIAQSIVKSVTKLFHKNFNISVPRRAIVTAFYSTIITVILMFSLVTVPKVIRDGNRFVSTLQSANPYVLAADGIRTTIGDDLAGKLEAFLTYSLEKGNTGVTDNIEFGKNTKSDYHKLVDAELNMSKKLAERGLLQDEKRPWTQERSKKLGSLLQKALGNYTRTAVQITTKLLKDASKFLLKAILCIIFSFMIMWDLPNIASGIQRLRKSTLRGAYNEFAPNITEFFGVLGKAFEAQSMIALVNTTLTTAGLIILKLPGIWFLSMVVFLLSFVPVAGVILSTLPMVIVALSDYGIQKAFAVVIMVALVHLIEAYVLNPQIYSAHLKLHPLLVLVVLYIAEHTYGFLGMFLGVPCTVYFLRLIFPSETQSLGPREALQEEMHKLEVDPKTVPPAVN